MRSTEHGEPAFPVHPDAHKCGDAECAMLSGMSLRDWFAGQALCLIAEYQCRDRDPDKSLSDAPTIAKKAYFVADAMIAAREAKS